MTSNRDMYIKEALDYLKEEAGQRVRYERWECYFKSTLFMMDETYQSPETRGEIMQIAYDIVDDWDK